MARGPRVGDAAPDFELVGTAGPFRLGDHRGERAQDPQGQDVAAL
ncbi:MAG: hypothetical protein QOK49_140, partial [Baekduia sp.]|nr:hypothetical protein [Baekduia sp.]